MNSKSLDENWRLIFIHLILAEKEVSLERDVAKEPTFQMTSANTLDERGQEEVVPVLSPIWKVTLDPNCRKTLELVLNCRCYSYSLKVAGNVTGLQYLHW